jgi:acetoin utilization protein AcuB
MNIESIMTRGLVTVDLDETVQAVRDKFAFHRFHHLLVLERGTLVGLITDRDLLANLSPFVGKPTERSQDHFLLERRAHQIMNRGVIAVSPDTPIKLALGRMLLEGGSCVVVCDAARVPTGIVTWHDMLRYLMECGVEPGCTLTRDLSQPRADAPREPDTRTTPSPFI